jgi:RimJ/RimL family protein N-acetyltransferase
MYGSDYAEFTARPSEYWQELVQRGAGGPHGITYVAETDGALIGMTTLIRETGIKVEHNGMIFRVYVHPDWRGLHLSEALVDAGLAYASVLGLRTVKLGVVVTNAAAIRCYLRCGFAVYGVEPGVIHYNDAYYDELLMARNLTRSRS